MGYIKRTAFPSKSSVTKRDPAAHVDHPVAIHCYFKFSFVTLQKKNPQKKKTLHKRANIKEALEMMGNVAASPTVQPKKNENEKLLWKSLSKKEIPNQGEWENNQSLQLFRKKRHL